MNFWMALLMIVAVALAITGLCAVLVWLEKKFPSNAFDERQQQVRGKAANWALLSGFAYFVGVAFADLLLPEGIQTSWFVLIFIGLALEALVYAVCCILKDANVPILKSPRQRILLDYLCGGLQLAAAAARTAEKHLSFSEDGQLVEKAFHEIPLSSAAFMELIAGVIFLLVGTMELVRLLRKKEA